MVHPDEPSSSRSVTEKCAFMHSKDEQVSLSDKERALIERVAAECGISFEEATNQLLHEAIAARFRRHLGRQPARVYDLNKSRT